DAGRPHRLREHRQPGNVAAFAKTSWPGAGGAGGSHRRHPSHRQRHSSCGRLIVVHSLFAPEVRLMLQENDVAGMKAFLETLHPATVADSLAGDLEVDQVWKFLEHTNIRNQAAIFEYFPIDWQVKLVEGTGRERMAHLIEQMSHDDRVDLLRRLMPRVADSLLRLVDEADRRDIATLYRQNPNTAGGVMTTDYAWLPPNLTATEALERLRLQAPGTETIYYIFILDDQRRLLG